MSKRRKFSVEFTRGAVEQASPPGVTCAQVAREPGIRGSLLTRWKREAQSPGAIAFGGSRFRSSDYQGYLAANGLVCSMIAVGHCGDNAPAKAFFELLKRERIYRTSYPTLDAARADVFDYIEQHHPGALARRAWQAQSAAWSLGGRRRGRR